jgi:hypothetical protein
MKKSRLILVAFIAIGSIVILLALAPSIFMRFFVHSQKKLVHNSADIENALLKLEQKKPSEAHVAFEISRKPHSVWNWSVNWIGAGVDHSWTQGDRIIEFANVGGTLVYSVPVRWREDKLAGPVVFETQTNVSPAMSGDEVYSTSEEEYTRLISFLIAKTPDAALSCSVSKDSTGRIAKDIEYFDGTLSLPQSEWGDFVKTLFKEVYNTEQPIYIEQIELKPFFSF